MKGALVLIGLLLLFYFWRAKQHATHPPGVLVAEEPDQAAIAEGTWDKNGYTIRSLARFHARARVLSTERYWFDNGAVLSPVDFALGWGRMSDQAVLDRISMSQGGRFYRYSPVDRKFPLPDEEIISHSANMHMIPADAHVDEDLKAVEAGDIVDFDGYLVQAEGPGGFKWRSSLTRADTGGGACELVWVERISRKW